MVRNTIKFIFIAILFAYQPAMAEQTETQNSSTQSAYNRVARLSCFNIERTQQKTKIQKSCDDLCKDREAVCTGMQNGAINPPVKCNDPLMSDFSICRCCNVEK
ncbi:MAG: hypothetical protein PHX43_08380 [Alphaproteobacteria bacterium]|nr:hypothetical protein [Alphaproteobacteria bacterium]